MLLVRREIARSKLRFGLFISAIGLLVFLILFFEVILGSLVTSFVGAIDHQSAPVLVYGGDARKNIAGSVVTPDQVDAVAAVAGVGESAPLGEATFTLVADGVEVDASVFGYRPGSVGSPTNLVAGRLPESPGEAVASEEDVGSGFGIGSTVSTSTGAAELRIVGLTRHSRYSVAPTLWVAFEDFEAMRRAVNPDARFVPASVVAVAPARGASVEDVVQAINSQVGGVQALTRSEAVSQAPAVAQVVRSVSMILVLAFIIVTLVIGFFFLILTVHKQESLTLLRALGAKRSYLAGALLAQIVIVALGGLSVGWALLYLSLGVAHGKVPLAVDLPLAVLTSIGVVAFALVGSSVTLWRTLKIDPAAAVSPQGQGGLA